VGNPADFENNEYNRDYSKALIHASAAYAAGATGAGITIAVIDTGIDEQHAEFLGGKLSSASIDIYDGSFATAFFNPAPANQRDHLDDQQGHGTGTASTAAGNKLPDGDPLLASFPSGMHGVAFGATILAIRADNTASGCAPDCDFDTTAIAAAIDYARLNGADVINMSLGGDPTVDAILRAAMIQAVNAGIVIVASAGNDGNASPDFPANFAADGASLGRAIAVGAAGPGGTISGFSNRAGPTLAQQNVYVVAPGEGLTVAYPIDLAVAEAAAIGQVSPCAGGNTCYDTFSAGTSFAAPEVAGAVALLLQHFPALAPEDAVEILLVTADDRGAAGLDPIYGRGLIDLAAAFAPMGPVSVNVGGALSPAAVPVGQLTLAPSGATGDWITASGLLEGAVMRDGYRRAISITPELGAAPSSALHAFEAAALTQRIGARRAVTPLPNGAFGYAAFRAPDDIYLTHPNLATDETLTPELSITLRQGPLSFAMGRGFAAPAPVGSSSAVTLMPSAASGAIAALTSAGDWASVGYELGAWSVSMRAAGDETRGMSAASLTRRIGLHEAGVELGSAHEDQTALGGAAGSRLGGGDAASTSFAALSWRGPALGGWRGTARLEAAEATLDMPSYVRVEDEPLASAWTVSFERPLTRGLDLGLTLAQPLRAESGRVAVVVPVGVTKVNASIYEERIAALTPSGREIDAEAALRFGLGARGEGRAAVRLAQDPGHVAGADPEAALWLGVRFTR
jgi:subtilisin family serine protease